MYKIALVNMPFGGLQYPSLGLTQLASVVEREYGDEVSVDVLYLNHDFKVFFGLDDYKYLADNGQTTVTGFTDWMFQSIAFPSLTDASHIYLNRYRHSLQISQDKLREFIEKRARIEEFLDGLIDNYGLDQYAIVGSTSMFDQGMSSFALAKMLKDRKPSIITLMGGAACELSAGATIAKKIAAVDYVFSGPALKTFTEFVGYQMRNEQHRCERIDGVYSKANVASLDKGTSLKIGAERDINDLVFLNYDSFLDSLARKCPELEPELFFETSRGCWWGEKSHCTFCGLNGVSMKHRSMEPQVALKQFEYLFDKYPSVKLFSAVDNIVDSSYFDAVFPHLKTPPGTSIFYEMKVITNERRLEIMAKAGVRKVQPGIESISTEVLTLMKKGTTAFQNIIFLRMAVKLGIVPDWNLLVGFPGESEGVYTKYLRDIPKLLHLPPPGACFPVRFDRYSPYFMSAATYSLKLKPLDFYAILYPFDEAEIREYAYFFADENYGSDYLLHLARWKRKVEAKVQEWNDKWHGTNGGLKPRLCMKPGTDVVVDTRSGAVNEYRLSRGKLELLRRIEKAEKLSTLSSSYDGPEDFDSVVHSLDELGLIFQEGDRIVNLITESRE